MENIVNNKTSESLISCILLFFAATIMFWIECGYSILYHANYFIAGYLILFSYASLFICFLNMENWEMPLQYFYISSQ